MCICDISIYMYIYIYVIYIYIYISIYIYTHDYIRNSLCVFPLFFSHFRTSSNLSVVLTHRPYTTLALHQWLVEPSRQLQTPRFCRTRCEITRRNGPKNKWVTGVKYHPTYRGCKVITYNSVSTTGWGPPWTPLKMKMLNRKNRLY